MIATGSTVFLHRWPMDGDRGEWCNPVLLLQTGIGEIMKSYRMAAFAVAAVVCVSLIGCAQDTPRSAFENSDEYAGRVFVPSLLSGSVQKVVADDKALTFNKITFTESATVNYQGSPMQMSQENTYESVGSGGLVRVTQLNYMNGVVAEEVFVLAYRGLLPLYTKTIKPNNQKMPYSMYTSSISHFEHSLDQPSLNYVYEVSSNAPHYRTVNRTLSCTLTKTYAASTLADGMQGDAKEFDCKFYNDNGALDTDTGFVYLNAYGIAIMKHMAKTSMDINMKITNFKVS
jgi:hypothetical protein